MHVEQTSYGDCTSNMFLQNFASPNKDSPFSNRASFHFPSVLMELVTTAINRMLWMWWCMAAKTSTCSLFLSLSLALPLSLSFSLRTLVSVTQTPFCEKAKKLCVGFLIGTPR